MNEISPLPGDYQLYLGLAEPEVLVIGRLGEFFFSRGIYVYLGSAHGPGGVRSRLERHLLGGSKKRWHIDFLRQFAIPLGYYYQTIDASASPGKLFLLEQALNLSLEAYKPLMSQMVDECYQADGNGSLSQGVPLECCWSTYLAAKPGVSIPAPGFGASDCRSGCMAHFFKLPGDP